MWSQIVFVVVLAVHGSKCRVADSQSPSLPESRNFEYFNTGTSRDGRVLYQSDIMLSDEQRENRQAVSNLWTSPVKYAISSTSTADRAAIQAGLNHWSSLTCIQFSEVGEGDSAPHLNFKKDEGCWSYVGKVTSTGGQDISIGDGCTSLGVVAHEVGHAMGLHHQQSRSDRDQYVLIRTANIQTGREGNFDIETSSSTHGVPYDYTSNMHYGSYYFSSNGQKTIQTVDIRYEELIGGRNGLSHRDQQIANIMYQCAASCSSAPTCQNGGFVDKSCACKCPPNTSGTNCETLTGDYYQISSCGNDNMDSEGTIKSPNYPENFPKNVVCYWIINAPAGKKVKVSITDMMMIEDSECYFDYLALRYSGSIYDNTKKACGSSLSGQSFTSTGQQFVVKFKSGDYGWYRGFSANVEFVDGNGSGTTTTAPGTTSAPGTTAPPTGKCAGARSL